MKNWGDISFYTSTYIIQNVLGKLAEKEEDKRLDKCMVIQMKIISMVF